MEDLQNKNSNACENGWFAYLDQKCIKALEKKGTVDEGLKACAGVDKQANLLSIHSEYEMSFLSQHLSKYNEISDNSWIGLKFIGKGFQWFDKTELDYQHWDVDAKRDGKLPCVQMSLTKASLGKWKDETCDRQNLIVCQKKQSTISVVSGDLKNLTKVVDEQQAKITAQRAIIDSHQNVLKQQETNFNNKLNQHQARIDQLSKVTIPIGFVYTQLPGQSDPHQIWPGTAWAHVSPQYAGFFFRAEGGGSAPFGTAQDQMQRVIEFESGQCGEEGVAGPITVQLNYYERFVWTGGEDGDSRGIKIKYHPDEIRPRNHAVRIWKRTG